MARTDLAVQTIAVTGLTPVLTAANVDGHAIPNDGRTFVEVLNSSGGSINVTVITAGTYHGRAIADDSAIAIGAGARKLIGPFKPDAVYNTTDNKVNVDFSAVTTVTCGAFRVS